MARALERLWPGVVRVSRRYKRPQHVINWRKFDTPLKLRADLEDAPAGRYDVRLVQVKDEIKSPYIRRMLEEDG